MNIQPIPLKDGSRITAHTRPSGDQATAIAKLIRKNAAAGTPEESTFDIILTLGTGWDVKGDDGEPLPFTRSGLGQAAWDIIDEIQDELAKFWGNQPTLEERLRLLAVDLTDDDPAREKVLALAEEVAPGN